MLLQHLLLACVALCRNPTAEGQGFSGIVAGNTCTMEQVTAVANSVDAACCTDADSCNDGPPAVCSGGCSVAMAQLKLGPCAERFALLTDTADGQPANGVSEVIDRLWRGCISLPAADIEAAVAARCPSIGAAGHRRLQPTSNEATNEQLLLSSVAGCVVTSDVAGEDGACVDDEDGAFAAAGTDCAAGLAAVGGSCDFNLAPFGPQAPLYLAAGTRVRDVCPLTCGDCGSCTDRGVGLSSCESVLHAGLTCDTDVSTVDSREPAGSLISHYCPVLCHTCPAGAASAVETYGYPCSPCEAPVPGSFPSWDSAAVRQGGGGMFGSQVVEVLNNNGRTFVLYQLDPQPPGSFTQDAVLNTKKYAALCARAGLSTVTSGDSMWGEPTALCAEYGCITLPAYAGGNAPQWVEDNTGWTDSVTHGVGTAAPVNSRDPFYDQDSTGWDIPLHPICALEAAEAPSPPPPSPAQGVGFR
eukprot:COSAG02_NODE_5985_length_3890_cov_2.441045_2_plen_471_part_00